MKAFNYYYYLIQFYPVLYNYLSVAVVAVVVVVVVVVVVELFCWMSFDDTGSDWMGGCRGVGGVNDVDFSIPFNCNSFVFFFCSSIQSIRRREFFNLNLQMRLRRQ